MIDKQIMKDVMADIENLSPFNKRLVYTETEIDKMYPTFLEVEKLLKECENYTFKEWEATIDKYRDNKSVLVSLLNTKNLPEELIPNVINCSTYFKVSSSIPLDELQFFCSFLPLKLSEKTFDALTNRAGAIMVSRIMDEFKSNPQNAINFDPVNIDRIGQINLERLCKLYEHSVPQLYTATPLMYVSREKVHEIAEQIFDEPTKFPPVVANALILNKFLNENNVEDQQLISDLFDNCDPALFYSTLDITIPQSVANNLSFSMNRCIEKKTDPKTGWVNLEDPEIIIAKRVIQKLAENYQLESSVERNIANFLVHLKERKNDDFIETIFSKTTDPVILRQIDKLLSTNKINVYVSNPNIPEDMIANKSEEYCKKISNYIDNKKRAKIPIDWYTYLSVFARRATLSVFCYNAIIKSESTKALKSVMTSNKTPIKVKQDFIDLYQDLRTKIKELEDNDSISDEEYGNLCNKEANLRKPYILALANSFFEKNMPEDFRISLGTLIDTSLTHDKISRITIDNLSSVIENLMRADFKLSKEYLNYINELTEKLPIDSPEHSFYSKLSILLTNKIKQKEIADKIMNEEVILLNKPLYKMGRTVSNCRNDLNVYTLLPQLVNEYAQKHKLFKDADYFKIIEDITEKLTYQPQKKSEDISR